MVWRIAIVGLALYGALIASLATARSVGVSPDSTLYLAAAQSVRDGRGPVVPAWTGAAVPLTHYPPLYPLALAAIARTGADLLIAARALNALLFGITILLAALAIDARAATFTRWGVLGAAIVATSVDLLGVHAMAWSEPLFLVLGLAGLSLLGAHLVTPRTWTLLLAAIAVALASLDRYPGVALIGAGALALLLAHGSFARRVGHAAVFSFVAGAPLALWMARNARLTGTTADLHLAVHRIAPWQAKAGIFTVASWMLPGASCCLGKPAIVLLGGAAFVACLAALAIVTRRTPVPCADSARVALRLGGLFVVVYLAVLALDMLLLDTTQWPDSRLMTPVFVAVVVIVFAWLRGLDASAGRQRARVATAIACALLALGVVAQARFAADARAHGLGYLHDDWTRSRVIARARALPADVPVYSNRPDAIRFLTGRAAAGVPLKRAFYSDRANPTYADEAGALRDRTLAGRAYLVWFRTDAWAEEHLAGRRELEEGWRVPALYRDDSGAIYGVARR